MNVAKDVQIKAKQNQTKYFKPSIPMDRENINRLLQVVDSDGGHIGRWLRNLILRELEMRKHKIE